MSEALRKMFRCHLRETSNAVAGRTRPRRGRARRPTDCRSFGFLSTRPIPFSAVSSSRSFRRASLSVAPFSAREETASTHSGGHGANGLATDGRPRSRSTVYVVIARKRRSRIGNTIVLTVDSPEIVMRLPQRWPHSSPLPIARHRPPRHWISKLDSASWRKSPREPHFWSRSEQERRAAGSPVRVNLASDRRGFVLCGTGADITRKHGGGSDECRNGPESNPG